MVGTHGEKSIELNYVFIASWWGPKLCGVRPAGAAHPF